MQIDVWDGTTLILIGSAHLDLRHFLRGNPDTDIQTFVALPVLNKTSGVEGSLGADSLVDADLSSGQPRGDVGAAAETRYPGWRGEGISGGARV